MLSLVLVVALALPQETVENPDHALWSGFKPGDWVRFIKRDESGTKLEEVEQILSEVQDTGILLRVRRRPESPTPEGGVLSEGEARIPARIPASQSWMNGAKQVDRGKREIDCGGAKVLCDWSRWTLDNGRVHELWILKGIPGGLARFTEKHGDGRGRELLAIAWKAAGTADVLPTPATTRARNDAARAKLAEGADLKIENQRLPQVCAELSKALGIPVFADASGVLNPNGKRVTLVLKRGSPVLDALGSSLKPHKLTWVLYEGAVIVTDAREKPILERGYAVGGPSDEALKSHTALWENREAEVELRADMTGLEAVAALSKALQTPFDARQLLILRESKLAWSATGPALVQLRLFCRYAGSEVHLDAKKPGFKSEPSAVSKGIKVSGVRQSVESARSAAYTGTERVYKTMVASLRGDRELALELIADAMESSSEDDRGRKALMRLAQDLK